MATLAFNGTDSIVYIGTTLTTSIQAIPNGPCTTAVLLRRQSDTGNADDVFGLRDGATPLTGANYYHGLRLVADGVASYTDDDGTGLVQWAGTGPTHPVGAGGNNFCIMVLDWGTGSATERMHVSGAIGSAESWGHADSDGVNNGLRAGPATGIYHIGNYDGQPFLGDIALIAIWAGTRFSDADAQALWVNKKTSDWYNHSAGTPDTLIELTSTSLTDLGADPASSITVSNATATGADPTGWDFDGQGEPPAVSDTQTRRYRIRRSRMTSW